MISLRGIKKYFPDTGVQALDRADFDLQPGEIHALVGENGAGKSTLMRILAGELSPSAGTADLGIGIGMVRQHPELPEHLKLWEAVILGAEPSWCGILRRSAARRAVGELNLRWRFDLDLNALTDSLSVSQRQKATILSLLYRGTRYLILDEVTAVLAPVETGRLFALLRSLRDEGVGIALISHKLGETLELCDRVTVLRRGTTVGCFPTAETSAQALTELIFPPAHRLSMGMPETGRPERGRGAAFLAVRGLAVRSPGFPDLRGIDLEVGRGRILAVAGVRESGLGTLELALAGLLPVAAGTIELGGSPVAGSSRRFRASGGAYIPADRVNRGSAARLSINDTLNIHNHRRALRGPWRRLGFLDGGLMARWSQRLLEAARIRSPLSRPAGSLSGGTLQRLILARELAEEPSFLLASEPGWGLDGESMRELEARLLALSARGAAILLLSTDLEELLHIADEVIVLHDGRVSARMEIRGDEEPEALIQSLGAAMTGGAA